MGTGKTGGFDGACPCGDGAGIRTWRLGDLPLELVRHLVEDESTAPGRVAGSVAMAAPRALAPV